MKRASTLQRRQWIKGAAALGAASIAPQLAAQSAPVRVGYAMARTGPWTGGAQVSQEPNFLLWAEQQNAAGGLLGCVAIGAVTAATGGRAGICSAAAETSPARA